MKRVTIYILILIGICFLIPIFFTVKFQIEKKIKEEEVPELNVEKYSYSDFGTIRLLHSKTSEVEEIPLDEYIVGVVAAEMPVDYDIEALKAQSVAARTYTIYKLIAGTPHENADICDNSACCQAWISKDARFEKWQDNKQEKWNKLVEAVNETLGEVITYDKKLINAFFHSNSGGMTENVSDVWGGKDLPYLVPVETKGEDAYSQYSSEAVFTKEELLNKLKEKFSDIEINFDEENCIEIKEFTQSGRVKLIRFGNKEMKGTEVRTLLNLRSTNFSIEKNENIVFKVIGYGHGVGMSQTGADALAKQGMKYNEILMHYYTGTEISKLD